jgi:hypothetical protein
LSSLGLREEGGVGSTVGGYPHLLDLAPVLLVSFLGVVFDDRGLGWDSLKRYSGKVVDAWVSLRIWAWWWFLAGKVDEKVRVI